MIGSLPSFVIPFRDFSENKLSVFVASRLYAMIRRKRMSEKFLGAMG